MTYYYIELEKFRNQNPDMKDPINQWLAFIDMERGDLLDMAEKENELIKEAKEEYDVLSGDEGVKRLAEIRLMSHLEEQAALACAREDGMAVGLKEGLEEGKKRGIEEGKIAKKRKEQKIDIRMISEITGITEEEIKKM